MLQSAILTNQAGFAERASRMVTVLINAGIAQGDRDGLCRIRNVSEGGLTVETSMALEVGEPTDILLHSGDTLPCVTRWVKDRQAGMSCAIDPTAMIATARPTDAAPTLPRFNRALTIELVVLGVPYRCALDSISTRDILATNVPVDLRLGQLFSVVIEGLGALPASVQVAEDGELFARFAPAISFATLDKWLASSQG